LNPVSANEPLNSHSNLQSRLQPRRVHTITDRFSIDNTYLIDEDRLVVVDPNSELNVRLLSDYIQKFLYRTLADIDLIVLTHLHPTQLTGIESLSRICAAPIAASVVLCTLVQSEQQGILPQVPSQTAHFVSHMSPGIPQYFERFSSPYFQQMKLVNLWLEDVASLPFHPDWRVIASPGYAPESLCLYNPFTGELLCGDTIATIEGRTPLLRRGINRYQLDETLRTLRGLDIHYLYPGHGRQIVGEKPLAGIQVERSSNLM